MPRNGVAGLVDEYGRANEEYKTADKAKKRTKKELMELGVDHEGSYDGKDYTLTVAVVPRKTLDPVKVAKKLPAKLFMECVSINLEKAKELMTPRDLDKCVSNETETLRFTSTKKQK